MNEPDRRSEAPPPQAAALRQRAEEVARERGAQSPESLEALALAAHPEDRAALDELNSAIPGDGFPRPIDFRIVRPGGVVRWVHAQGQQERDETGRVVALAGFVQDITERKRAEAALREKVEELRQALDQIKTLSGILPICMHCKKIRDDKGSWNRMEIYIRDRTEAEFSHGICPECMKKLYPEVRGGNTAPERGGNPMNREPLDPSASVLC